MAKGVWEFLFNPKALMVIFLFLIFVFGGANFIFNNPIIIAFGIFAMIIMTMGGRRK